MNVRPATLADATPMATAHVRSWQAAYAHILPRDFLAGLSLEKRAAGWERVLKAGESTNAVAEAEGAVVGFVSFGRCRDEDAPPNCAEIWAIYASPDHWSKGVGRLLMEHALTQLAEGGYSETSLWVLAENTRAIRFYERFGFNVVQASAKRFTLGGVEVEELQLIQRNAA